MILTYRYRVKDAFTKRHLSSHAWAVNQVWNYCCETQRQAMRWRRRWPTAFDLIKLCTGSSAALGIHSDTISAVCRKFAVARIRFATARAFAPALAPAALLAGCRSFLAL